MPSDSGWKAVIDAGLCMGTGACELLAPEYFTISENGVAEYHPEAGPVSAERLDGVAHRCPQGAIKIIRCRAGR